MGRLILFGVVASLASAGLWGQADNRTIIGSGNEFLSAGAFSIRMGQYDEGIRLTRLGLTRYQPSPADRGRCRIQSVRRLCGAGRPGCGHRALHGIVTSGRAKLARLQQPAPYAYFLLGLLSESTFDLDAAAAINPNARQVLQLGV